MDEPTSALDFDNQVKVLRLAKNLSEMGYAVIMTTHNPEHSLLLDCKVWMLDHKGHMETGTADELVNLRMLSGLYSADLAVSRPEDSERNVCFIKSLGKR